MRARACVCVYLRLLSLVDDVNAPVSDGCCSHSSLKSLTPPTIIHRHPPGPIPSLSAALIHGYLPGPDGGLGVAEVIFGKTNPSGRLPFTYQKHQNGPTLTYYHKLRQRDYDVECAW
jgi:hypothetical protein